jgi:pimeloyl-ACP methyl ester carboxylesterase
MTDELQRIDLATGVSLDVQVAGDPANPPVILLHGFPESHRTWRHVLPDLARDHFVIAPDQRGYARSSKPDGVAEYTPDKIVADLIALADHFGIATFTLVGHDWGGAVSWMAALRHPDRITRLVIINAPHPFIMQKTLFDDMEQREASQYITAFRNPAIEQHIDRIGLSSFFAGSFMKHTDFDRIADETPERPAFLDGPFPPVTQPTLVIWGIGDAALRPSQIEGLADYVPKLTLEKVDAGHFVPWENPDAVIKAIRAWEG